MPYPLTTASAFSGNIIITTSGKVGIGYQSQDANTMLAIDGKVGLGTTDKTFALSLQESEQVRILYAEYNTEPRIHIGDPEGVETLITDNKIVINSGGAESEIELKFGSTGASKILYSPTNQYFRYYGTAEILRITQTGRVGIGTTNPPTNTQLLVNGDVEVLDQGKSLILRSPNGGRYRLTVDTSGNVTTASV